MNIYDTNLLYLLADLLLYRYEFSPVMEKVTMIKESKETEENKVLGYDVTGYAKEFKKRFNK